MPSPTEITVAQLARLIGTPDAPTIVDVCLDEDFDADPRLIPGSFRHPHSRVEELVPTLAQQRVVVVCHKGRKLSQGSAAILRYAGVVCETLAGGHLAWAEAGLPMVPVDKLPPSDGHGRTVWVTRHRPKIDRIACPWLIRRFVDRRALFLFVSPSEVLDVADRFGAAPFDIENVFWSHRGDSSTFDTMIDEFALSDTGPSATVWRRSCAELTPIVMIWLRKLRACLQRHSGLSRMYRDDLAQLEAQAWHFMTRSIAGRVMRQKRATTGRLHYRKSAADAGERSLAETRLEAEPSAPSDLSLWQAIRVWARIGVLSFGGPSAQIALMHRVIVDEKKWLSEQQYLNRAGVLHAAARP